ncbi:MAG: serine/threonine-protein kinase, partial [Kofleriaceae bacterium]
MSTKLPDVETDATVAATPGTVPTVASAHDDTPSQPSLTSYELGGVIGRGGMGEVVMARDPRIGREIAFKRIRTAGNPELRSRFLREARIQARLEHPAIVPVHEIGEAADGSPYFTMKRVVGTTLLELIPRDGELQRLLRALVDVCLAVEFAHARGVVHRDLKPANIILGEFGEVYLLDWGVARVIAEHEPTSTSDIDSISGMTSAGAMLGTPGYMAPEQVADASSAGTAADVYALGSILFELLAREPLHARGLAALASTVAGLDGSPLSRRPSAEIPPELDTLCVEALALEPERRPTARAFADRLQRYLDGDRDIARRRALASEYLAGAREALADPQGGRHVEAMRLAGSAVALDPESREAVAEFARIMLEPPRVLPAGLRSALAASDAATQRRQSRVAAWS